MVMMYTEDKSILSSVYRVFILFLLLTQFMQISIIIYPPISCYKPVWIPYVEHKKKKITEHLLVAIDFHRREEKL